MDSCGRLLRQIRHRQLLLCAYRPQEDGPPESLSLADLAAGLRIGSSDCLALVERLHSKGILEPGFGAEAGSLRLTARGQRLVSRMMRVPEGTPPPRSVAEETREDPAPVAI